MPEAAKDVHDVLEGLEVVLYVLEAERVVR